MAKRSALAILILCIITISLHAGDVAHFVNLGFSSNSRYLMFGQYGIDEPEAKPFAEIYIVNVPANDFTSDGVQRQDFGVELSPGQDGSGAFYTLLEGNTVLTRKYDIDHLSIGRLVYILLDGEQPKSHIEFRDFNTGNRYVVNLIQALYESGETIQASFHIQLTVVSGSGSTKTFTVGLPGYKREGIAAYRIRQIILSPDGESLIFVVEKEYPNDNGKTIRYMVETVSFR